MGVSSLTLHAVALDIRVEDECSNPLTSGRFVYAIGIQHILPGTNV